MLNFWLQRLLTLFPQTCHVNKITNNTKTFTFIKVSSQIENWNAANPTSRIQQVHFKNEKSSPIMRDPVPMMPNVMVAVLMTTLEVN